MYAATYFDLTNNIPLADAQFLAEQLDAEATVEQATIAWMTLQNQRIAAAEAELASINRRLGIRPGVKPLVGACLSPSTDAIETWNERRDAKIAAGMTKAQAVTRLAKEDPALHAEYVAAFNAARQQQ